MEIYFSLLSFITVVSAFRGNVITDEAMSTGKVDCKATQDSGHCDGQEEAWYFSPEGRCTFFVYSGCGGNGNRFRSRENCEAACISHPPCPDIDCPASCTVSKGADHCDVCACRKDEAALICRQPRSRGYCRALQHKWSWDNTLNKCVRFIYGGCGGNENKFDTEEGCDKICNQLL